MASVPRLAPMLSLHPGDWYFGSDYERLHTVLGSCVALVTWHPRFKLGGMCHYLLPCAPAKKHYALDDARYANVALKKLKTAMDNLARTDQYQISLFGGGDMFAYSTPTSVGRDNIAYARQWLSKEKIRLHQLDVGGASSRSLSLWLSTGEIELKRYAMDKD